MPKSMQVGTDGPVYFTYPFSVKCTGACSDAVPEAISRFYDNVFVNGSGSVPSGPTLSTCSLSVAADAPLELGVNESYSLSVSSKGCFIQSANQWGALHALESLSQLLFWTPYENTYSVRNTSVVIEDEPRFAWRGLLIDTARHYLEPSAINRTLMAMAANRFNTLHLHVVE